MNPLFVQKHSRAPPITNPSLEQCGARCFLSSCSGQSKRLESPSSSVSSFLSTKTSILQARLTFPAFEVHSLLDKLKINLISLILSSEVLAKLIRKEGQVNESFQMFKVKKKRQGHADRRKRKPKVLVVGDALEVCLDVKM